VDGVRWLRKVSISALVTAIEMEFTGLCGRICTSVGGSSSPHSAHRGSYAYITDYIFREGSRRVYDGINRIYEKPAKEDDIRERYIKLVLACLPAMPYLSVKIIVLSE
jgi:hypothetical protein